MSDKGWRERKKELLGAELFLAESIAKMRQRFNMTDDEVLYVLSSAVNARIGNQTQDAFKKMRKKA